MRYYYHTVKQTKGYNHVRTNSKQRRTDLSHGLSRYYTIVYIGVSMIYYVDRMVNGQPEALEILEGSYKEWTGCYCKINMVGIV